MTKHPVLPLPNKKNHNIGFQRNAISIFAAKLLPALSIFLTWMFYARKLSLIDYGSFQVFWIQVMTLSGLSLLGFPIFILTYPPQQINAILEYIYRKRKVLISIVLLGSALLLSVLQYYHNQLSIPVTVIFFILYIGMQISDALLLAYKSFRWCILLNFSYAVFFGLVHYIIYLQGYTLERLILALLLLLGLKLLFSLIGINKSFKQYSSTNNSPSNWTQTEKLWKQLGLHDGIQMAFKWIDKFILSFILSEGLYAIYVNATIEIAFLPLIFTAVSSAAIQHWAIQQQDKNTETDKIKVLHYSSSILSSIVFPLFCFLLFFSKAFLASLFSEKYLLGVHIFICAQLVLPVRAFPFTALLQSLHRGDLINKGAIIDFIIACLLMYPLYLLMGLPGVALSFVISTYWQAAYYLRQSATLLHLHIKHILPVKMLISKLLLTGILFAIASYLLNRFDCSYLLQFTIGLLLLGISSLAWLFYHRQTSPNEL